MSAALRRWNSSAAVRSQSVSPSPESTQNVSSRNPAAAFTPPAVPSGVFSTWYISSTPQRAPSPKWSRMLSGI